MKQTFTEELQEKEQKKKQNPDFEESQSREALNRETEPDSHVYVCLYKWV